MYKLGGNMAIIYANGDNFDASIENGITLVDFYAEWCGPCKMLSPILEMLDQEQTKVQIIKVDVDADPAIAQRYGVMSMPTMIVFKDGEKVDQKVGLLSKEALEAWFEQL